MQIIKKKSTKHVGLKILFLTKGSIFVDKNSAWVLYRRKWLYEFFNYLGKIGVFLIIFLITTVRLKKKIEIERINNAYLVDCKGNICRDLKTAKIINKKNILEKVKIKFKFWRTIKESFGIVKEFKTEYDTRSAEDYSLLIDYSWFYSVISQHLSLEKNLKLIIAKDLSPYSSAFVSLANDKRLEVSLYSIKGMVPEKGIVDNDEIFSNIFVASEKEKYEYERKGRRVYYSIPVNMAKIQRIKNQINCVGLLMSSHADKWGNDLIELNVRNSIEKIKKQYSVEKIILRPHPNEINKIKKIFSIHNEYIQIHEGELDDFLDEIDFIVCGGTSSAIQALEMGKIVLYDETIDCYFPDTYALFKDSVLINIESQKKICQINEYYDSKEFAQKLDKYILMRKCKRSLSEIKKIFSS